MTHVVDVVPDDKLPEDVRWTMVETGDDVLLFVKRSWAAQAEVLAEAWAAYCRIERRRGHRWGQAS